MKITPAASGLFLLFVSVFTACKKDTGDAAAVQQIGNTCKYSTVFNGVFEKINANTTYNDLFKIFLAAGDNYQTLATNSDTIAYYRWYDCTDSSYFIEVDLEGGKPRMAKKTIMDTSCAANVSVAGYDSLKAGMSFPAVQQLLGGHGDHFRDDYEMPGNYLKTSWYRFTSCSDSSARIEVQISAVTGFTIAEKSF